MNMNPDRAGALVRQLWESCDTILLDMDGTLLDLAFDNWFWLEAVPRWLARKEHDAAPAVVRDRLFASYADRRGSLDWYCLEFWTRTLGLDLRGLKEAASHRIRYLSGARDFLCSARSAGNKRLVLVTNAHPQTLAVKRAVTGLDRLLDDCISSHELGVPKENATFWPRLRERLAFDPGYTLFIDDSPPVLDAAAAFGLAGVVAIRRPDSSAPAHAVAGHLAIDGVAELC